LDKTKPPHKLTHPTHTYETQGPLRRCSFPPTHDDTPSPSSPDDSDATTMMAAPTTTNRDEAVRTLLKWCKTISPNFFIKESLVGFKTKSDGSVTAVALKDIPADTALIRVTPELMFSARDLKRKWRSVFNEIESKVRRYTDTQEGFLTGPE
jgi:hypothetical protein